MVTNRVAMAVPCSISPKDYGPPLAAHPWLGRPSDAAANRRASAVGWTGYTGQDNVHMIGG